MDELMTKESLKTLGFEVREVSKRELELSYIALKDKYETNSNKKLLEKVTSAYNYLTKDIRVTNEVIRNILDPLNKTYIYEEKPEGFIEEKKEDDSNEDIRDSRPVYNNRQGEIKVIDKPSVFIFVMCVFLPVYGFLNFAALKRLMPKSSKVYLVAGILGFILEILLLIAMFLA